jgi:hypothetical protein
VVIAIDPAGRSGDPARAAAHALIAAYRAAGVAVVEEGRTPIDPGDPAAADDRQIIARAAQLGLTTRTAEPAHASKPDPDASVREGAIAIVRAFAETSGVRAVVTLYRGNGELITGFSAVAGQPMTAPAPAAPAPPTTVAVTSPTPPADGTVADELMRARSTQPTPDKDGVVRLWLPGARSLQLLRQKVFYGSGASLGVTNIVCRAPCGEVVDGSLGEEFTVGERESSVSPAFALTGHTGDVTVNFKPANSTRIKVGGWLALASLGAIVTGGFVWAYNGDDQHIYKSMLGAGVVGMPLFIMLGRSGAPEVSLSAGRPR